MTAAADREVAGVQAARPRPVVHFTADDGWINDPYGITWDGQRYHLFFQTIPGRVTWSPSCHWGHATSSDLVHWQEQAIALVPQPYEVGCWSGSLVCDGAGQPTILYTRVTGTDWGQGQVALAHGDPTATSWTTDDEAVIAGPPPELRAHSFRDPFVWRNDHGWTMLMGAGLEDGSGAALQYSSQDLTKWTYDGVLCSRPGDRSDDVWTGTLWECPQLFRLGDHWVLLVSVWDADVLHYVAAAIGEYDGTRFEPRTWQRLTDGNSAYAMSAFTDRDGRRCAISWLREEPQNNSELSTRAGAHSVVSLIERDQNDRLTLRPHPDLEALRGAPLAVGETGRTEEVPFAGRAIEVFLTPSTAQLVTLEHAGARRVRVEVSPGSGAITVDRPGFESANLPAEGGRDVRVLIDADIVEVFGEGHYGAYRIVPAMTAEPSVLSLEGNDAQSALVYPLQRINDPARTGSSPKR